MAEATTPTAKRGARAPKATPPAPERSATSPSRFRLTEPQRRFLREVGGIVLGVLIALGIGAITDAIAWKVRAYSAEKAARQELALIRGVADERAVVQPCLKHRLEELDAILLEARRTGVLPNIGRIGEARIRPMPHSAIGVMVDSEIALHVASAKANEYATISNVLPKLEDGLQAEMVGWATLRVLENAPGPIDSDLLASTVIARAELSYRSRMNGLGLVQIGEVMALQGVAPDHAYMLPSGQTWEQQRLSYPQSPICRPLLVDGKPYVARTSPQETPTVRP